MKDRASDSNPFSAWQEWLERSGEFWTKLPSGYANADAQQTWPSIFQAWADLWIKFFTQAPSPGLFQRGQKLWQEQIETWTRTLAQAMGSEATDPYQMWRHLFGAWAEAWIKFLTQAPSPELFQRGQKLWMEQIEAWTKVLAQVMGSEAYAASLAQTTGQRLAWLENVQETIYPQADAALRMFNLPSRSQINRLLEQLADVQKRLDDLTEQSQSLLKGVAARSEGDVASAGQRRAARPGSSPQRQPSARRQGGRLGRGGEQPA